jgi:hypothetical protein
MPAHINTVAGADFASAQCVATGTQQCSGFSADYCAIAGCVDDSNKSKDRDRFCEIKETRRPSHYVLAAT